MISVNMLRDGLIKFCFLFNHFAGVGASRGYEGGGDWDKCEIKVYGLQRLTRQTYLHIHFLSTWTSSPLQTTDFISDLLTTWILKVYDIQRLTNISNTSNVWHAKHIYLSSYTSVSYQLVQVHHCGGQIFNNLNLSTIAGDRWLRTWERCKSCAPRSKPSSSLPTPSRSWTRMQVKTITRVPDVVRRALSDTLWAIFAIGFVAKEPPLCLVALLPTSGKGYSPHPHPTTRIPNSSVRHVFPSQKSRVAISWEPRVIS